MTAILLVKRSDWVRPDTVTHMTFVPWSCPRARAKLQHYTANNLF